MRRLYTVPVWGGHPHKPAGVAAVGEVYFLPNPNRLLLLLYLFKPDISRVALRIVLRRCSLSSAFSPTSSPAP